MSKPPKLKAPFPYFGGKSKVAHLVWERLGEVDNYIEPFFGSGATLLLRPDPPRIETINDLDCYVANFWRATQRDPAAVAAHADWPVNEADLHARHKWLVLSAESITFRAAMREFPDHFDAKIAGWWCWGICCWIGSGWCQADRAESRQMPRLASHEGRGGTHINNENLLPAGKAPNLTGRSKADVEKGVNRGPKLTEQIPFLGQGSHPGREQGRGVNRMVLDGPSDTNRPQLADAFSRGRGVNSNDSAGTCEARRLWLLDWFGRLRDRLRPVRVCCGDWKRVCDSPSVTTRLGLTGIFLDPPYAKQREDGEENRSANLYANDGSQDVNQLVKEVRAYCLERGSDPLMRIALCGYEGEGHEPLESAGWEVVEWKASGGYGNRSAKGRENATRERIWFSPHCLKPGEDLPLFMGNG